MYWINRIHAAMIGAAASRCFMQIEDCPRLALFLVSDMFRSKAAEKGNVNTCTVDPQVSLKKATDHLELVYRDEEYVKNLILAIGHLMVALQVKVRNAYFK